MYAAATLESIKHVPSSKKRESDVPRLKGSGRHYGNITLPPIKNCISNKESSEIDRYGFVEISGVLGSSLIESIYQDAVRKVVQHKSDEAEALTELFSSSPKKRKRQKMMWKLYPMHFK